MCLRRFRFASYCCGWLQIIFISGIQVVFSITPGSVSLVHGVAHDKSVAYLFSTPQSRSQKQTEILYSLVEETRPRK